jgi:hypothetical protein
MGCQKCSSENQSAFSGEIGIHFPGIEGLQKPLVFVYSEVSVCLDCGYADFNVPESELKVLATGVPVDGAVVLIAGDEIP